MRPDFDDTCEQFEEWYSEDTEQKMIDVERFCLAQDRAYEFSMACGFDHYWAHALECSACAWGNYVHHCNHCCKPMSIDWDCSCQAWADYHYDRYEADAMQASRQIEAYLSGVDFASAAK